jgi:hypothetical protein
MANLVLLASDKHPHHVLATLKSCILHGSLAVVTRLDFRCGEDPLGFEAVIDNWQSHGRVASTCGLSLSRVGTRR